ncbi:MAG: 16S rRNA (cytosine(1402)-N(4))-methyltransferase RsmH [Lachnospiraceae bacterium]|nr:16S rRNA (cytosine(1402)-N(4))-methyltransferase RsmH [Lachnospiraceae bacterium]MDY6221411.1 16S rRNA (cytosine(1402)-N(4))-methyltransferase RsmH [Candidatus Alectryocaccobium sp.]
MDFEHISVLLSETIDSLNIKPEGTYVDGTLGGAGHSSEICRHLNGNGRLIGFDQDEDAIAAASARLEGFNDRVTVIRSNFCNMAEELTKRGIHKADGILLDLGVSSHQLDEAERGFSYRFDAPLDMRMDRSGGRTAADVVNTYDEERLFHVIKEYGEERFAGRIARSICRQRENKPIETTGELAEIIKDSIPAKARMNGGHPAKRTFQAIRIEVNAELEVLENSIDSMIDILADRGRLCIIAFHSLEDRIVKNAFRRNENPCTCPPDFPICVCGKKSKGVVITRKPIIPTEEEIRMNLRSHSAKLRVFERRIDMTQF